MKRILVLLAIFLLACGSGLAGPRNFDKSLEKQIEDYKKGKKTGSDKVRVIIQTLGDPDSQGVSGEVGRNGGKTVHKFETFDGIAAEIPVSQLEKLGGHGAAMLVSEDTPVASHGESDTSAGLSSVVAAMDPNRIASGAPNAWLKYGVMGRQVGVAVLDSGVAKVGDLSNNIVQTVDLVSDSTAPSDPFGHGTAVAGVIAGMGVMSNYKYVGGAPQASIFNVRVLDENGRGYTSTVIAGIEWVIRHRMSTDDDGVDIRVINLSLGHAPAESADTDPLTLACRKAVRAGIVVVVSAGNYGKDAHGNTVFGGITSPGIEPSVITVGAMSTFNTASRIDDKVASYSSRGPTIDGMIKPDITAPGSQIIVPLAPGNKLAKTYPQIVLNSNYMKLSGTSLSAPMVAGTVALMLQRNPNLTPNAVKAILMYTAERTNKNPLEVGAGYVNALGAVNLAGNIDTSKSLSQYWIVNNGLGLTHADTVAGYTMVWGGTIVWEDALYSGNNMYYNQAVWGSTICWGDSYRNWSTTIVWEVGLASLNGLIKNQTIVWEDCLTIVWDDVMTIAWDDIF